MFLKHIGLLYNILDIGPGHQMHPLILGCEFPKVQRSRCETKNTTSERTAKNHAIPVKIVSSTPMMFHVGSLFCESIPMPVLVVTRGLKTYVVPFSDCLFFRSASLHIC